MNYIPKQKAYVYTDTLIEIARKLDEKNFKLLHQELDHYINEFNSIKKSGLYNDESIAFNIMQMIDNEVNKQLKATPQSFSCKNGCSHCCLQPVMITKEEGTLLRAYTKEKNILIDEDKLVRQSKFDSDNWKSNTREDMSCVFLDSNGSCKVYEYRPVACRKYFVLSPPDDCKIENETKQVLRWNSPTAEIMASAVLNVFGSDMMARVLMETGK